MKCQVKKLLAITMVVELSGCGIGGHWMTGDPFYKTNVKPYMYQWEKPGMTEEGRKRDWVACGGMANGNYSSDVPSGSTTEAILRSAARKKKAIGACMSGKGYR